MHAPPLNLAAWPKTKFWWIPPSSPTLQNLYWWPIITGNYLDRTNRGCFWKPLQRAFSKISRSNISWIICLQSPKQCIRPLRTSKYYSQLPDALHELISGQLMSINHKNFNKDLNEEFLHSLQLSPWIHLRPIVGCSSILKMIHPKLRLRATILQKRRQHPSWSCL